MKLSNNKGFTLVELVVVIFIMAILGATMIANFRAGERSKRVQIAFDTAVNAVRNAQNFTLAGKAVSNSSCTQGKSPLGYEVFFSSGTSISLYGIDKCNVANLIESYPYPRNTAAGGYRVDGASPSSFEIKFSTPYAQILAAQDATTPNSKTFGNFGTATVTFQSTDGNVSKILTIDGIAGRIGE